ncbi:peroxiredoxin family protein [Schlesneria sp.]|uniref:peroxiredoxin family protein n=1 Tax=Schlesneria sp. TaxID=2762018 RepID=UPI002EDC8056
MKPEQQKRLIELFAACSLKRIPDDEHQELQDALRSDQESRELWFLYQDVELGLKRFTQVHGTIDGQQSVSPSNHENTSSGFNANDGHLRTADFQVSRLGTRRLISKTLLVACVGLVTIAIYIGSHWAHLEPADRGRIAGAFPGSFTVKSPTHNATFTVPSESGKLIALHFLLKSECPFCLKLTHDYSLLARSEQDVVHLFVKPDSDEEIREWAGKINLQDLDGPPVIYRDPDARLADEFQIPDGYQFHGQSMHYPALVLLDRSGHELFRYVGKDNTDRMQPEDFVSRLSMVTGHE